MKMHVYYLIVFILSSQTCLFGQSRLLQSFIEENSTGSNDFGYSVSTAGDVNGDGYSDIIVGAPGYHNRTGEVYIYLGGSSADNTADITITGENENDEFGYSVSSAGDVNGDGFSDVIIGAPRTYSNLTPGKAYIYFGGSSMDNTADLYFVGASSGEHLGSAVSTAGDVNHDGYDDVIIGAPDYDSYKGRAYIYFGGTSMDTTADVVITGSATYGTLGKSVSWAGNVNGANADGTQYDDVIVGEPGNDKSYIYYGGSSMDAVADVYLEGENSGDNFGCSVSNAGDINNDGYDDVIVGAEEYNSDRGKAYIYFGGSPMDYTADATMTGENEGDKFAHSVSYAGDVNKDNYSDVIVGAWAYDSNTGKAYIYFGNNSINPTPSADITVTGETANSNFGYSVFTAGDVNNDGYDDVIIGAQRYGSWLGRAYVLNGGSSMDNTVDLTVTGKKTDNLYGYSVSGAGDVNGDGYDDIIIGAYNYYYETGRAYVYFGSSSMDNTADLILTGNATYNRFGISVSRAGDVNNDGYDDIIIGAERYDSFKGRAYIYFGNSLMDNIADVVMTGANSDDYFGYTVSNAGDVNNDGYDDVIVGAPGYNNGNCDGRAYIYFGASGSSMNNTADIVLDDGESGDCFAISVSTAGDVNGDGYDDIIVGADYYYYRTGIASVFYGGNPMNSGADVTMYGENKYDHFGYSVSTAGDVNGDGYDDVIVGAEGNNSHTGGAYIFYGSGSMDAVADVTMYGEATDNYFGRSVSYAGDVNNDSYADVIIGADGYNNNTGRAYVFYGGGSMDATADIIVTGENADCYFGYSVSNAGDIDNDNYDDFIVGSYNYPENGKTYLFSSSDAPTPVELVSFTAKVVSGKVTLNWQTASETNNYGFQVERKKTKGESNWENIGFVKGAGNSNSPKKYSFADNVTESGRYSYRLKQIDLNGTFEYSNIVEVNIGSPDKFELMQNYPNPFNPVTTIKYSIPSVIASDPDLSGERGNLSDSQQNQQIVHRILRTTNLTSSNSCNDADVQLIVYDILGRKIATLVNKKQSSGTYAVKFDASNLPSGVYFYQLKAGDFVAVKKMILMK